MAWTKRKPARRKTSSFLIWEVELSTSRFSASRTASSKSRLQLETLTSEAKTSTTDWCSTSSRSSRGRTGVPTLQRIQKRSEGSVPSASVQRRLFRPRRSPGWRSTPSLMASTSPRSSPVRGSTTCAWITSRTPWCPWRKCCATPRCPRARSTTSCSSEGRRASQRSKNSSRTSSTARSLASRSTLMRPLPTVLLFKPPS
mmetsp:Transcript_4567/g.8198  ORF Transcript_4567/g.8198 Transcript_4567/m.8198 type:complete len:200 (-) Transcript_4567:911-1510(-)